MSNNDTFKLTAPAEKNSGGFHHSLNSATPLGKKSYQQGSERLSFFPSYNLRYSLLAWQEYADVRVAVPFLGEAWDNLSCLHGH